MSAYLYVSNIDTSSNVFLYCTKNVEKMQNFSGLSGLGIQVHIKENETDRMKKMKSILTGALLVVTLCMLIACGTNNNAANDNANSTTANDNAATDNNAVIDNNAVTYNNTATGSNTAADNNGTTNNTDNTN